MGTNLYSRFAPVAVDAAKRAGVDPNIFLRLISAESSWDSDVIYGTRRSSAGAQGIAQFMPATAREVGVNPLDPVAALYASARYLKNQINYFGGDVRKGVAAYNAGAGNIERGIYPAETRAYLTQIFETGGGYPYGGGYGAGGGGPSPQDMMYTDPKTGITTITQGGYKILGTFNKIDGSWNPIATIKPGDDPGKYNLTAAQQLALKAADRNFDMQMQAARFGFEAGESALGRQFQAGESAADRALSRELNALNIDATRRNQLLTTASNLLGQLAETRTRAEQMRMQGQQTLGETLGENPFRFAYMRAGAEAPEVDPVTEWRGELESATKRYGEMANAPLPQVNLGGQTPEMEQIVQNLQSQVGQKFPGMPTPQFFGLPGMAGGGQAMGPQAVMVGEQGPEVMILPPGDEATVLPITGAAQEGGTFGGLSAGAWDAVRKLPQLGELTRAALRGYEGTPMQTGSTLETFRNVGGIPGPGRFDKNLSRVEKYTPWMRSGFGYNPPGAQVQDTKTPAFGGMGDLLTVPMGKESFTLPAPHKVAGTLMRLYRTAPNVFNLIASAYRVAGMPTEDLMTMAALATPTGRDRQMMMVT